MMLKMDHEEDGQVVMTAMKQLGNELYTATHLSRTNVESAHETSLVQFKKKQQQDQWTQGMQCYWCWKLGHKSADCSRRQAGQPKLPRPGSTITGAPGGGGNNGGGNTGGGGNNNNNSDGGGKSFFVPDVRDSTSRRTVIKTPRMLRSVQRVGVLRKNLVQFR
jgi:phosphoribosyl-AMP cyclohydrolase